jgi:hypothetical protein
MLRIRVSMKCPECQTELGGPVGYDIYPLEDNPDGTPGGVVEEDQYICDGCKRFVSHRVIMEHGTVKEELVAGGVMGGDADND